MEENSEYWSQKQTQSENIHSIILDVHVDWQSAQKFPVQSTVFIELITESRHRHARGHVQLHIETFTYIEEFEGGWGWGGGNCCTGYSWEGGEMSNKLCLI